MDFISSNAAIMSISLFESKVLFSKLFIASPISSASLFRCSLSTSWQKKRHVIHTKVWKNNTRDSEMWCVVIYWVEKKNSPHPLRAKVQNFLLHQTQQHNLNFVGLSSLQVQPSTSCIWSRTGILGFPNRSEINYI